MPSSREEIVVGRVNRFVGVPRRGNRLNNWNRTQCGSCFNEHMIVETVDLFMAKGRGTATTRTGRRQRYVPPVTSRSTAAEVLCVNQKKAASLVDGWRLAVSEPVHRGATPSSGPDATESAVLPMRMRRL